MIPVTKPYLPSRKKLDKYIDGIFEREWLTNNGPLVQELTTRLEDYLGVGNLLLVSNGTLALQIAYRALGIHEPLNGKPAEAITTPFTFVATSTSLKWEGVEPVFADIDADTWCLDPKNIEPAITSQTKAIVPVHVFGNACEVETIDQIATEHGLKVIYDAAHAFGVKYKGESLLKWGDAATLSFHATKVFHTIEGGAIVFKRKEDLEKAKKLISFGITGSETIEELGINAKMNEFQAAMGLAVLDEINKIDCERKRVFVEYDMHVKGRVHTQRWSNETSQNYAYYPIVFDSEIELLRTKAIFEDRGIYPRRYFFPSLEGITYLRGNSCSISSELSRRVLCLPVYSRLNTSFIISTFTNLFDRQPILDISNYSVDEIVKFIAKMDSFFQPQMAERVCLSTYVTKLKKYGRILGSIDGDGNLTSIIGFYANDSSSHSSYISYLAVDQALRGQGVAKDLLRRSLLISKLAGMTDCKVSTWANNEVAITLYKKSGFTVRRHEESDERVTVHLSRSL